MMCMCSVRKIGDQKKRQHSDTNEKRIVITNWLRDILFELYVYEFTIGVIWSFDREQVQNSLGSGSSSNSSKQNKTKISKILYAE